MRTITLCFLLICSGLSAQSIFTNPITDSNPSAYNPFTLGQTVSSDITVSGIGRGPGINANSGSNRYNATAWSFPAFDANDYFTFTLTPNSGKKINFVSFVYTGQRSSTGPNSFAFRSSLDNFQANIGTPTATGATISLSAAQYQDITSPIEFRFYGWAGTNAAGTYSINDFTFNGTTAPLPITLSAFSAQKQEATVVLSFSTATESNNDYFSIERSADGNRFDEIGKVNGAGNSTETKNYTFIDENPLQGINYYRLKQVDFDGQFTYSHVVSVQVGKAAAFRLSPQPVNDQLRVQFEEPLRNDANWQLIDFSGRQVLSGTAAAETEILNIDMTTLTKGTYVLRIVDGDAAMVKQFQKQ